MPEEITIKYRADVDELREKLQQIIDLLKQVSDLQEEINKCKINIEVESKAA